MKGWDFGEGKVKVVDWWSSVWEEKKEVWWWRQIVVKVGEWVVATLEGWNFKCVYIEGAENMATTIGFPLWVNFFFFLLSLSTKKNYYEWIISDLKISKSKNL